VSDNNNPQPVDLTLKQAHRCVKFRSIGNGRYELSGPFGWEYCTLAENQWLESHKDQHIPMASLYKRPNEKARCFAAFDVFVVPDIKKGPAVW